MLQIAYIRENRDEVVQKLAKKNMDAIDAIDEVIALDTPARGRARAVLDRVTARLQCCPCQSVRPWASVR